MPTGSGKTKTSIESILDYWKVNNPTSFIVWLAHTEELCEQAFEKFQELWSLRGQSETSHVLRAMGLDDKKARESFRISFNAALTKNQILDATNFIIRGCSKLRNI